MTNYPPEGDTPNGTPIYDRAVPRTEGDDLGDDVFDGDEAALTGDATRRDATPGVHLPSYADTSGTYADTSGTSGTYAGASDTYGTDTTTSTAAGLGSAGLGTASTGGTGSSGISGNGSTVDTGTSSGSTGGDSGRADQAKDAAKGVAGDAKDAGQHVGGVAKEQASKVASEAADHARALYGEATSNLKEQAGTQQQKAADGLRTLSEQLSDMAQGSEQGVAASLVRDLSNRAGTAAGYLEGRDPGSLLDEVKSFAARRPGAFIAIAAGAGILAGRLTKALTTEIKHEHEEGGGITGTGASS